ncbi:uncharacterized protein DUF397 [Murinocardiopsis flavida]|uniref:Uncharacterized protein DUF397 n=1 Tax=Murinocardiopsis flavida TaxID=645275 RepID=A0A2P8DEJ9_9ACTN|nr:DUF397 domain-containing protein [Murinocardiopsis flavida]PSK95656.1 uncharacterized protein DUF397 [Murinocardiopsis flavida]
MNESVFVRGGWHKSRYSDTGGQCVEVAETTAGALVCDTQNRKAGCLAFPSAEWAALLHDIRSGDM